MRILLFVLMVLMLGGSVPAQGCATFQIGDRAILATGDVFDGEIVEVFQQAWYPNGEPVWMVEILRADKPRPYGFTGATDCEMVPVR